MKVKLIAMTDAMFEDRPIGNPTSAEYVCNHAARTCTKEDAGLLLHRTYWDEEPFVSWKVDDLKPLESAVSSGHESILEHAVYTFEIKGVSRALTHQLVRHRIASYSQQSQRYVKMDGFEYVTPKSIEDATSSVWTDSDGNLTDTLGIYENLMEKIHSIYSDMIKSGIPEEDARYVLPNACCTNIIVTMNARELRHFFALRCCERAQWEIRAMANKMLRICKEVSPTIFANAGPSCVVTGRCPEGKRSCGRIKA